MADLNQNIRTFENGGTLDIADGATNLVFNIEEGSLRWTPVVYENMEWTDRNVLQQPKQGRPVAGTLSCEVKCGEFSGSGSLYAKLMTAATAGAQELFSTVVIKIPAYRGGSAGESLTFTNAYLDTSSPPEYTAGGGSTFDKLSFRLKFLSGPAAATY